MQLIEGQAGSGQQTQRNGGPARPEGSGASVSGTGAPMSVLVVDDAASTRRFLRGVLDNSHQFEVVGEATDGSEAVDKAGALQPDLVLLDLVMPTMSGTNALAEILKVSAHSIVVIVSGAPEATADPIIDTGAAAYIPKGIPPYDLLHRLCTIVGRPFAFDGPDGWDQMDAQNRRSPTALPAPVAARGRAIVYDPDPVVRALIARVLTSSGVLVIAETNTVSILLTAVNLAQPEFVVLDLSSGGPPDTTTLAEIRKRSALSSIVVYTKSAEWRESALAAGATAFISKPRIDELANRICHLSPSH
jgi:DNA-binding NarL/FixJ family response regulator